MKISLNTIQQMNQMFKATPSDITAGGSQAIVDNIGAKLGAVEEVTKYGEKFQGIIIAKVISCQKHPDADRLSVCQIDDGGQYDKTEGRKDGLVQVVCGAPNVRAGLSVAWLPPGTTVPNTYGKDPLVLESREIRGVISNGMLASPKELSLGEGHQGILEIDGDPKPGTDFASAYGLQDDLIIDIENKMFTHRPDCFGILGVARELAGIQGVAYTSPDWYIPAPAFPADEAESLPLTITNEIPELVPRFMAVVLSGLQIKPSPVWLQVELAKVGSRSINNIVDHTNYFMQITGQPLHAYDYDKLKALSSKEAAIVIRHPKAGEKLTLLNNKQIEPLAENIVIATDKQAIGMGGVMGGADTEVDENTKNIILECATFDMYSTRRTSMAHGLFTDAVTRFNKGQSPLQNAAVLGRIIQQISRDAGGKVASKVLDDNHLEPRVLERQSLYSPVEVSISFINSRLGLELTAQQMKVLLENVEFRVTLKDDQLLVTAPFWRTDIEIREDIVEEIGRLYGYDKLPLNLPQRDLTPAIKDEQLACKTAIRSSLVKAGANELLTYSFVPAKLLENAGQNPKDAFKISSALSPDLQYYRLSLTPSLLQKVHPNIKMGYQQFALFELGKAHNLNHADDDEGLPTEFDMLDLVVAASDKTKHDGAAFYQAKLYLDSLAHDFGLELIYKAVPKASDYPVAQPYDYQRSAVVHDKLTGGAFGLIGEYTSCVRKAFKLPKYSAGFSISPIHLLNAGKQAPSTYRPLPRFPKVSQDITLKVPASLAYQELHDFILEQTEANQPDQSISNLKAFDIYHKADDPANKQVSLRLTIANYQRTLTDKEVNNLLETVASAATERYGAVRL